MDRKYLLDASALLAVIRNEPGADRVLAVLDDSEIHAVNLAEVVRKLVASGKRLEETTAMIDGLCLEVLADLSVKQAYAVAGLTPEARRLGLSLGDCVCLAMADWMGMTAVTADRRWSELNSGSVQVLQIRS